MHFTDQNALDLMTDGELTQSLSNVEEAALNGINTIVGPYSVFQTGIGLDETPPRLPDSSHSPVEDSVATQLTMSSTDHLSSLSDPSETSSQHFSANGESGTISIIETARQDNDVDVISTFESDEEGISHLKSFDR